jgi:hypothetical protein
MLVLNEPLGRDPAKKRNQVSSTISTDPVSRNKDKLSNTSLKINDILVISWKMD